MPTITHAGPFLLDTDSSLARLKPNRATWLLNVVPGLDHERLAAGMVQIAAGQPVPAGRNRVVGVVADPEGQSLVRFVWNALGEHRLLRVYPLTGVEVELLRPPLLDLREEDFISQTGIVGDFLGWLDRDGVQYRLNMTVAGAGGYASITDPYFFRLARRVPLHPPDVQRRTTVAPGLNLIEKNDWQLAYRYGYDENDVTVLSPYSTIDRATKGNESINALIVTLPTQEVPPVGVNRIEFYARKNDAAIWQRVSTLKRDAAGRFPVEPNFGVTGFVFLGRLYGDALDDAEAQKLSEAIPITSKVLAAADSRFFLANNEEGYAATGASPTVALEDVPVSTRITPRGLYDVKLGYKLRSDDANNREGYAYFILVEGTHATANARYVNAAYNPTLDLYFEVENARRFKYGDDLVNETIRILGDMTPGEDILRTTTDHPGNFVKTVQYLSLVSYRTVKANSYWQFGISFFDHAGRGCGTLTSENSAVSSGGFAPTAMPRVAQQFRWTLDPATAAAQVPPFALTYRIVMTPNLRYAAFKQFHAAELLLAQAGTDEEKPEFMPLDSPGGTLWVDISALAGAGDGYAWQADSNDRLRIYLSQTGDEAKDFKITSQRGGYLLAATSESYAFSRQARVEIYSPQEVVEGVFYEVGPAYPVLRDANGVARYSVLSDTVEGDVVVNTRLLPGLIGIAVQPDNYEFPTNYYPDQATGIFVSSGSLIHKDLGSSGGFLDLSLFGSKTQDASVVYTAYYKAPTGNARVKRYGLYSGQNIASGSPPKATGAAGLPDFYEAYSDYPANKWLNDRGRPSAVLADGSPLPAKRAVDVRWGGVLLPGSRINGLASFNDEDVVSLKQEAGPITSLKLASQQQSAGKVLVAVQAYGGASLYLGQAVLTQPTGESLRADSSKVVGTVQPWSGNKGSVHAGSVTPWNGRIHFWSQQHATVLRYGQDGVTDLCKDHQCEKLGRELAALNAYRVVGGYDPEADVFLLTFYYRGVHTLRTRTIGYSERAKGFCGDYSFASPAYASLGEYLYSFDGAAVEQHTPDGPRNTFYGVLEPAEVEIIANPEFRQSKEWLSLAYHGTDAWDTPALSNEQAGGLVQQSITYAGWAAWRQGTYTVALRRDQLQPVYGPDATYITDANQLLHLGRPLQSPWLRIRMRLLSDKDVRLDGVSVNFNLLNGQQAVPN